MITFTTPDYKSIVETIYGKTYGETAEHEIEYSKDGFTLILQVLHSIEYHDEVGGSYESYDRESFAAVDKEDFDILAAVCLDEDGEETESDFDRVQLKKLLN